MDKGIPRLHESVNDSIISVQGQCVNVSLRFRVSHVRGMCFLTAVSDELNGVGVPYFPRRLSRGNFINTKK